MRGRRRSRGRCSSWRASRSASTPRGSSARAPSWEASEDMATTTGTPSTANGAAGTGTAWDEHRPPNLDLIADCVHCGFCLPTCPSYAVFEEEMDSPRGRIVLMRVGHEEGAEVSDEMVTHFDRCLGCMACVTACPSGVQYDKLIEQTRPQLERHADRPLRDRAYRRAIFELFTHPGRLRALAPVLALQQRTGLNAAL